MRRGIVLFITLAILLMLSSVIFLFLQQSDRLKKSVRENIAIIQTNLILNDISSFLKSQSFTQDEVFFGAGIPVSLDMGPVSGFLSIDSAQKRININALLDAIQKDQQTLDSVMNWMERQNLKNPQLLLALLLDTFDNDLYERERGSEIRIGKPWFQNGSIPNRRSLETILATYRTLSGDGNVTVERWEEIFGYEGAIIDINYANSAQLRLLYPDFTPSAIAAIAAHDTRYENPDDLPIDEEFKTAILQPHLGITPVLSTETIAVAIDFNTTQECSGTISFRMGLKKKTITHLALSPIHCP